MALSSEEMMLVREEALTPLGQHLAPAIVTCVIYFLYDCLAVYNYVITKYGWYDVVIISASFRTVAMGCRAALLVNYSPGIQGTFLAFFNAGFAASGAAIFFTLGAWFKHKGIPLFSENGDKIARLFCYLMAVPIIAFGPILGVVAAGLIYGAWRTAPHAAYLGARCRNATTYGILGVFIILFVWVIILNIKLFFVLRARKHAVSSKREGGQTAQAMKKPQLIWIFIPVVAIELIRGCTGVVALYETKEFVWVEDKWFYCLDVLPDLIVLTILCWPKLLARISCSYPSQQDGPGGREGESEKSQANDSQVNDGKQEV